jgi:HNH endonuclease
MTASVVASSARERFWSMVQKTDGCWEWAGTLHRTGYARFYFRRKAAAGHRVAWELECGPIPDGLLVCHRCDNKRCVRLDHLFLGTARDNVLDMVAKGRHVFFRGSRHPRALVTEGQVLEIRRRSIAGERTIRLAAAFGLSKSAAQHIVSGYSWRHLSHGRHP